MITQGARRRSRSLVYDAKECNAVAPKSVARGAPRSGNRAAVGAETARLYIAWALASRCGVAPSYKALLRPSRSRPILPQPIRDKDLRAGCFVRLLGKGIDHSFRRLSRIPSRKAAVASAWDLFRGSRGHKIPDILYFPGKSAV
jgi:hypothetical protein